MLTSFAELNVTSHLSWCCPVIREGGPLVIKKGRHPIMAELPGEHSKVTVPVGDTTVLGDEGIGISGFVPNDTFIDPIQSLHVVSGVNGSGKTTYVLLHSLQTQPVHH